MLNIEPSTAITILVVTVIVGGLLSALFGHVDFVWAYDPADREMHPTDMLQEIYNLRRQRLRLVNDLKNRGATDDDIKKLLDV